MSDPLTLDLVINITLTSIVILLSVFIISFGLFILVAPKKVLINTAIWLHYKFHSLWNCKCGEK